MPNKLSPGVYIEEVSSGNKPIAGVGTSTGAFVGIAEKGTADKAKLITNWTQFTTEFGGFLPNSYLAYGVYSFFAEGGTSCYVVRVLPSKAAAASVVCKDKAGAEVFTVTARSEGAWGNRITVTIEDATDAVKDSALFKMKVDYTEGFSDEYEGTGISEEFDKISLKDMAEKINEISVLVTVKVKDAASTSRPANGAYKLEKGADGFDIKDSADKKIGEEYNDVDFIGDSESKKGLHAFDEIDDINIVAIPDKAGDRNVILEGLKYCKERKDCFFVADAQRGLTPSEAKNFKSGTDKFAGNPFNSSYGALYYPWVYILDPMTGKKKLIPPSGAVAGTYAYTDSQIGVHKAPAGITDGYLDSVIGIERIVTKGEQDSLNPVGVNVIRSLPEGICIWGVRTLSADAEWQYINVRRLMLYIEKSVEKGSQWVVFEPNSQALWGKVKRNLSAFLTRVWRDGALFGTTPEEAFIVKVDSENNPPEVIDAGYLIIEVAVAPVKPAEFVVIKISQKVLAKK